MQFYFSFLFCEPIFVVNKKNETKKRLVFISSEKNETKTCQNNRKVSVVSALAWCDVLLSKVRSDFEFVTNNECISAGNKNHSTIHNFANIAILFKICSRGAERGICVSFLFTHTHTHHHNRMIDVINWVLFYRPQTIYANITYRC